MNPCWCKTVMAILIIIFVWMDASWIKIAITIIAAIIVLMSLWGGCCCKGKCECAKEEKNK